MRHIAYTDTVIDTEGRLADLVLEYARVLAEANSADTISIPYRSASGAIERITMLVGPASQLTTWGDDEGDGLGPAADEAALDLRRRIRERTPGFVPAEAAEPALEFDDFDDMGRIGE